jgi:hypothetical protein
MTSPASELSPGSWASAARLLVRGLAIVCAAGGCSPAASDAEARGAPPNPGSTCAAGVLGNRSLDIDIELRALEVDGTDAPLHDGDDLALLLPPQGGRVAFVGVRATNLDGCAVQLTGAIRDEASQAVRFDARTVNLNPTGDGWGTSGTQKQSISAARSAYANVPLCPNQWATADIFDHEFLVEVTIRERQGRTATKSVKVTPRCAEPDNRAECLCTCKHGYVLGEQCASR